MTPDDHLRWFRENIEFFSSIGVDQLDLAVPTCAGWTVASLLPHLSFGLGICYPIAAMTAPDTAADRVFVDADPSSASLAGSEAVAAFRQNLSNCANALSAMDPDKPCWTYAGPGTVAFWIRRAAVETMVHRFDAEKALGAEVSGLHLDRAEDAIAETLSFAFELACTKIGAPSSALRINATDLPGEYVVGAGNPASTLIGDAHSLSLALWGRHEHVEVAVDGDTQAANEWLTLVGRAFKGR